MNAQATNVLDVTDATFEQQVVEESKNRPVVVDLWASWCGPCKTLGPILERAAEEHKGDFLLAKLDVDANQMTAAQFGVQSIPTVVAFKDGQPVDGFVGALPEPNVKQWISALLPTEADREASEATQEAEAGDVAGAEKRFREALASDENNAQARVGLANILVERGDVEEARKLVEPLLPDPEAERVMAAIRVKEWGHDQTPGTLASAKRLAARGRWPEALDAMLGALGDDEEAREAMVDAFMVLGEDSELAREYRGKLANALY
ncbi:MAG: thioredoxin [Actinomycetota bacterium]|nr:thioredoxin [Actinomycetota bacterium]